MAGRRHGWRDRRAVIGALAVAMLLPTLVFTATVPSVSAAVPIGFTESVVFSGLVNPTAVRFAPDGRVFVAEKRGTVQMFDSTTDATPTQVADLRTEVHNFWDRGLLGLAVDPAFPTRPYLYVLYTFDGPVGGTAPTWGLVGQDSDPCPTPPGPTSDGCVVSSKLARLTLTGATTTKQDLVHDWCQQFPSHSAGDLAFGPDGALYASGGDGASFDFVDYGQAGSPVNPCGDPPGGVGAVLTPPSAEGGALRSQDLRTPGDPVSLDGTVIRVSPDTGAGLPDNPNAASSDPNARRVVAHGFRNPFRLTVRPGTSEVWVSDVGWNAWEEVDRIVAPTASVTNYGWPCFEGDDRQGAYDSANLAICENLYAAGTADTKPYFRYRHGQSLNASDNCNVTRGSSSTGLAFQFYTGGPYPEEYDGALFMADYSRNCIWVMTKGTDGLPDKVKVKPFVSDAAGPVDIELSPGGELFYVDIGGGTIRKIAYGTPAGGGSCPVGEYLAEYFANKTLFGAPASTACEPAPLDHDWGLGGPTGVGPDNFSARWSGRFEFPTTGTYTFTATSDDGIRVWVDGALVIDEWRDQSPTTFSATRTLTAGTRDVVVEWFETGWGAVAKLSWTAPAANGAPVPVITSPAAGTTWQVGETITFTGTATDPEDGTLPPSALWWEMVLLHCPSDCHEHPLQSWSGVAGASISAPDHEYPSHLELRLRATDASGLTATTTRRLDPRTVDVTVASEPPGLLLTLGTQTAAAPFTSTLIVGSSTGLSAPSPQTLGGTSYEFSSWSDGGAATHNVTAGATAATYTATFTPGTTPGCPAGQYRAEYFDNVALGGSPAITVCEPAPLDHDWGLGAPPGVGPDNFSARWTGRFDFPTAGSYTFTATSDDGMRVWVDGAILIDEWRDQSPTSFTASRALAAGAHDVVVEWYDSGYGAVAGLSWAAATNAPPQPVIATPAAGTTWQVGQSIAFTGSATDPQDGTLPASALAWEAVVQHCAPTCHAHTVGTWSGVSGASFTAPDHEYPAYLELRLTATDSAGAAATTSLRLDPRTVAVTVASQPAGLQLTVGSQTGPAPLTATMIVGATATVSAPSPQTLSGTTYEWTSWSDGGAQTHTVTAPATATTYTATYAAVPASGCPVGQYRAEYFSNRTLNGTPTTTVCEPAPLDRSWGSGGPVGLQSNNFSVRWIGTITFTGGSTTFTASSDDGMRVWLDGVQIVDRWGGSGTTTVTRTVSPGNHEVRVDYYERSGTAFARLAWTP